MRYPLTFDQDGWSIPAGDVTLYVDGQSGNDANPGTVGSPYLTADAAIDAVGLYNANSHVIRWVNTQGPTTREAGSTLLAGTRAKNHVLTTDSATQSVTPSGFALASIDNNEESRQGPKNWSIIGIDFYNPDKDESVPGFDPDGDLMANYPAVFDFLVRIENMLVEGCAFRFCQIVPQENTRSSSNLIFRRCLSYGNWGNTGGFAQGMFTQSINSLLIEECIFEHNGWRIQQSTFGGTEFTQGQARFFNHNVYMNDLINAVFRKNTSLRPGSIHTKVISEDINGGGVPQARQISIHDNFYHDGEIVASIGGNTDLDNGARFQNISFCNNVCIEIGLSRPTNRDVCWGLEARDWDSGIIKGNIFSNFIAEGWPTSNHFHLSISEEFSNVEISDNIFNTSIAGYGGENMVIFGSGTYSNISFERNIVQNNDASGRLIVISNATSAGITFGNNTYYSPNPTPFMINGVAMDFAAWQAATGDTTSTFVQTTFVAPDRTFADYCAFNGQTVQQAYDSIRALEYKGIATTPYQAETVNEYFRAGFSQGGAVVHLLFSDDLESASEVSNPTLAEVLPETDVLLADNLESASEVSSPALAHTPIEVNLLANDLESASELSSPELKSMITIIGPTLTTTLSYDGSSWVVS